MRPIIVTTTFLFCFSLIFPPSTLAQPELDAVTTSVRELCILPDRQGNHWEVEAGADGATIFKIVDLGLSIEFSASEWDGIRDKIEDRPDARQCVRELIPIFLDHLRSSRTEGRHIRPTFELGKKLALPSAGTACRSENEFDSDHLRDGLTDYNKEIHAAAQEIPLPLHVDLTYEAFHSSDFHDVYNFYLDHLKSLEEKVALSIGYYANQLVIFLERSFRSEITIQQKIRAREEGFSPELLDRSPSIDYMRRVQNCELANFERAKYSLQGRLLSLNIAMDQEMDIDPLSILESHDRMNLGRKVTLFYGKIESIISNI